MRKLTYLTLLAMAVTACNGGKNDTCDTGVTTTTTTTHTLSDATDAWSLKVEDATVCDGYTWDLTGQEYTSSDCPGCDYAFLITSTTPGSSNGADVPPCPSDSPFPYAFPAFGSYYTGFGYVSSGSLNPYGGQLTGTATNAFFTFLDYNGTIYYPQFHSGSITFYAGGGTYGPFDYGSNFTDSDGSISWNNPDESFTSGTFANTRFCSGVHIRNEPDDYNDPAPDDPSDPVTAAISSDNSDDSMAGSVANCTKSMSDSYTVEVAAGDTLTATVDQSAAAHLFDSKIWINDSDGCTVARGDDQFNCTAGQCTQITTTGNSLFDCCSGTKATNTASDPAIYTIFVVSTQASGTCDSTTNSARSADDTEGDYTLSIQTTSGGASLTADKDDYYPTLHNAFSGSGTVTTDTTTTTTPNDPTCGQ